MIFWFFDFYLHVSFFLYSTTSWPAGLLCCDVLDGALDIFSNKITFHQVGTLFIELGIPARSF